MFKAAFVLCLQMLLSATNRQLWATCFTKLVGRAAAIGVGLPFGVFVLSYSHCCHFP